MIDAAAGGSDARRHVVTAGAGYRQVVRVIAGVILVDELDPRVGFHVIQRRPRRRLSLSPRLGLVVRRPSSSTPRVLWSRSRQCRTVRRPYKSRRRPSRHWYREPAYSATSTLRFRRGPFPAPSCPGRIPSFDANATTHTTAIAMPIRILFMCCSLRESDQNLSIRGQCVSIRFLERNRKLKAGFTALREAFESIDHGVPRGLNCHTVRLKASSGGNSLSGCESLSE